jgi:hypothetical protein
VIDNQEYFVEGQSPWAPGLWYFVSRLHGITRAVELAAVMREIKSHPMRVVPVPRASQGSK